jgi:hypothetical protein
LKTTNGGGVGINDNSCFYKRLQTYPNPVNDKLTIETPGVTRNTFLSISNVNGQDLINRCITELKTQIDVSTLPAGVYSIRLKNENIIEVTKIIKE